MSEERTEEQTPEKSTSMAKAIKQLTYAASHLQAAHGNGELPDLGWYATLMSLANYLEFGPKFFKSSLVAHLERQVDELKNLPEA